MLSIRPQLLPHWEQTEYWDTRKDGHSVLKKTNPWQTWHLSPTPTADSVLSCCTWNPQNPFQPRVSSSQSTNPYALASLTRKFSFVVSHLETVLLGKKKEKKKETVFLESGKWDAIWKGKEIMFCLLVTLEECFSNPNMHTNHLGTLLKCRFRIRSSGEGWDSPLLGRCQVVPILLLRTPYLDCYTHSSGVYSVYIVVYPVYTVETYIQDNRQILPYPRSVVLNHRQFWPPSWYLGMSGSIFGCHNWRWRWGATGI